ncbi:isochorismatase family protein [Helicobacter cetorum]|uniref:isochorismatase family protein n=1 Tax=Helicobacter cetorum TaxID=138563 RepID=UPI000CF0AE1C|nr:isochorismatase family protein [Helicobacter cetorum]
MKKILLIIDMQKGFMRNETTLSLAQKINALLELDIFELVVASQFKNTTHSMYEKLFSWTNLKETKEQELAINKDKIDFIEEKTIYNVINDSFMHKLCALNNGEYPKEIYLVGADTDCCVLVNAVSLFEKNVRPIVLSEYCFSNAGLESHLAGIKCLERLIGKKQIKNHLIKHKKDLLV